MGGGVYEGRGCSVGRVFKLWAFTCDWQIMAGDRELSRGKRCDRWPGWPLGRQRSPLTPALMLWAPFGFDDYILEHKQEDTGNRNRSIIDSSGRRVARPLLADSRQLARETESQKSLESLRHRSSSPVSENIPIRKVSNITRSGEKNYCWMSRTAKLTLLLTSSITGLTVWGVHFLQTSERDVSNRDTFFFFFSVFCFISIRTLSAS
jgi:hypothetical protein